MKITAIRRSRRSGFTLIELMVALVIGLLLVLVIAQLFIGSRRTFATTDDVSRIQENMRFATQILSRTIHQAGYFTSPNTSGSLIFAAPNHMVEGIAGAGTAPDEIRVRFQGYTNPATGVVETIVNCRGETVAANVMSENRFTIETVGGVPSLVCRTNTDNFVGQYVVIADVDNMKVLYGEDTGLDLSVDRFGTFASVTNTTKIRLVRISMLFRSPNVATTTALNTNTYTLNGQAIGPFNDTRARRDTVFTVGIRNSR